MSEAICAVASRAPNAQEQLLKREALALWEADRARLMLRQPFVALLALRLDLIPVVDSRLDTACTDGERIFVSAPFLNTLSPSDREFVLAHEVWHCAARHPVRRGRREPRRWNIAADHEVNALLKDEGLTLPADCVYFPDLHGSNAETVYASQACQALAGGESDRGRLADRHGLPVGGGGEVRDPDLDTFGTSGDWSAWPARVVAVAQQLERSRGHLPAGIATFVNGYRHPQLPWRAILSRFVTRTLGDERSWLPPSRRGIAQGLYLPSRRGQQLELALAIDTSASTRADLRDFLGELMGIVSSFGRYRLQLLFCDAEVQRVETFTDADALDPDRINFRGQGGTSFIPVFEYFECHEAPRALLYFTDGYGRAPERPPPFPVLWVLSGRGRQPARWGESLQLDRGE